MAEGDAEEPGPNLSAQPMSDQAHALGGIGDDAGAEPVSGALEQVAVTCATPMVDAAPQASLSRNQLKRLKRKQQWEEKKEDRKRVRKEKKHNRVARRQEERQRQFAAAIAAGQNPEEILKASKPPKWKPSPVPVTFIIDCDFEEYMRDPEIVSLSSQLTRSYSQTRHGRHHAHLFISSFKGKLKTRFDTVLSGNYLKWKNVHIVQEDFVDAAKQASDLMAGPQGGELIDVFKPESGQESSTGPVQNESDAAPIPEPEAEDVERSIVYLTSESPYTLDKLEPYTSYVI